MGQNAAARRLQQPKSMEYEADLADFERLSFFESADGLSSRKIAVYFRPSLAIWRCQPH